MAVTHRRSAREIFQVEGDSGGNREARDDNGRAVGFDLLQFGHGIGARERAVGAV